MATLEFYLRLKLDKSELDAALEEVAAAESQFANAVQRLRRALDKVEECKIRAEAAKDWKDS